MMVKNLVIDDLNKEAGMDTLVREVFAVTVDTPADKLEALVNRLKNGKVEWGSNEEDALEWAMEDMERAESEENWAEYNRLFWLIDVLGNIRHTYMEAHQQEIVADYLPSQFEIDYAKAIFGENWERPVD